MGNASQHQQGVVGVDPNAQLVVQYTTDARDYI